MKRRHIAIAGVALCLASYAVTNIQAEERPNFVIFIADDMAWDDCGAYGHGSIRTPNIDRLAAEGMRFDKAFLTCSSCSPSRCSILTGRYPHATGASELHQPLPGDQTLWASALRKSGYYTAALGKWHLGPDVKNQLDLVTEGGSEGATSHWLPTVESRPKDRPFFFWLASTDPHRPYQEETIPQPHTPDEVVVPPYFPDVPEVRKDLGLYYDEIARLDTNVGRVMAELERQGVADNTWVLFMSDNGRPFPRCKTLVLDSGIQTPFIVRWPDRIEAGSVTDGLVSSVDIGPTVLDLAGVDRLKSLQGRSFAKILSDPDARGRKYVFAEHNWHDYQSFERGVRSDRFTYVWNGLPQLSMSPPADAVNSITYEAMQRLHAEGKLAPEQTECFTTPTPVERLHDTRADPHSLENLAKDPEYAAVLEEMRTVLAAWRERTSDTMSDDLTPDGFDRTTGDRLGKTNRPAGY